MLVGAYVRTPLPWDIVRHDFQSCRTMKRKSLLFHGKASFDAPIYLVKKQPSGERGIRGGGELLRSFCSPTYKNNND